MAERKIGKYTILGELGRGGMGIVYKAEDPYIGRTVAIKTIRLDDTSRPEAQEEATKRFIREAQSAGNLSHSNIVTIYDVGEDSGLMYIAMEYIAGRSLEDFLSSHQKFSLEEIRSLISQLGQALDYAHSRGVVHRDIKPGNILLDNTGIPHIVDFGIARIATSTLTITGTSLGTPHYMAPEQVAGKRVDHRADIFSLGAILYELLTLEKAYSGDSFTSIIYKIMNEEPPPLRTFDKRLPDQLDYVIKKALAKKPEQRYSSCQQLTDDFWNYQELSVPVYTEIPAQDEARYEQHAPEQEEIPASDFVPETGEEKKRKPFLIALLISMMVLVMGAAVVVYFFMIKPASQASSGGAQPPISPSLADSKTELQAKSEITQVQPKEQVLEEKKIDLTQLLDSGTKAFNSGDFDGCIRQMEEVLKHDPDNSSAHYFLEEAKKGLKLREKQNTINNSLRSARDAFQKKDYQESMRQAVNVLNLERDNPDAEKYLVDSNLELGIQAFNAKGYAECIMYMSEVLKLDPRNDRAQKYLKEAQESSSAASKDKIIQEKLSAAQRAFENKNFQQAIIQSEGVLVIDPNNAKAREYFLTSHKQLGLDEFSKGNYQQCIEHMQAVLKMDPNDNTAKNSIDRTSLKIQERNVDSHLNKAQSYYQQKNFQACIQETLYALKIDPDNKKAEEYLALAKFQLAPDKLNTIVNQYIEAVKNQTLLGFYRDRCAPSFYEKIKGDTSTLISLYTDFQISVSNISIQFQDSSHGQVSFSHVMTGVAKSTGSRNALSEGIITWTMEDQSADKFSDNWKIVSISYSRKEISWP